MITPKQNNEYLLDFTIESNSLQDLLEILANICENLDLSYLNPRIKHFKYFQFTFFGLMVKAKGLLERMIFKAEFLKGSIPEFKIIFDKLVRLQRRIKKAYESIYSNKMIKGKVEIIACFREYQLIFENIQKIRAKLILV